MKGNWIYYAGLVAVSAIWGSNYAFTRYVLESLDPVLYTFIRFVIALPLFFILLKLREGNVKIEARDAGKIALAGLLGVTILEFSSINAIKYTTLTNASLLSTAPLPIFVALFSLFANETMTARLLVGGGAAITGVCLIILGGHGSFDLNSHYMLGNMLALNVSIVGALYSLFSMSLMRKYSALRMTSWFILFGTIFMIPFTWSSWEKVNWAELAAPVYAALIYNVLLCTVLSFVIWNICMKKLGATKASFFRYITPMAAAIVGFLIYREPSGTLQLIGAFIICFGLIWINTEKAATVIHKKDAKA
ncbi:DMT family transporter [Paenibacillus montanisoli]|uniref:EamA/RhaT family transporter n=1 Tax=Paenibacillus montanisoli TaxID=2081970 RepID=A0A328U5T4_9BACL|nr:DMT family transporter [Paenibacillus montanisoli]RAP77919.1 EamA/RhaT family transporter [Paenibacillus montanisoli]